MSVRFHRPDDSRGVDGRRNQIARDATVGDFDEERVGTDLMDVGWPFAWLPDTRIQERSKSTSRNRSAISSPRRSPVNVVAGPF